MKYTELQVTSNFSFLRGGSHPEELVDRAAELGYEEIAITDRNTLAGIVRAHAAAKKKGIRLIPGACLHLQDGPPLLALPTHKEAYARLSGLLSCGNLRAEKGDCHLYKADVYSYAEGIKLIIIAPPALNAVFGFDEAFIRDIREYRRVLGKELYLGASRTYQANDGKRLALLAQLSKEIDIPLVATNDVHYHHPHRRELQDVLTCIREKCTIYNAGYKLHQHAERYLKPQHEMQRLFAHYPDAIQRTQELVAECKFSLKELRYVYPEEITSEGRTPQEELPKLVWEGAREKFPNGIPAKVKETIEYELEFIERKNYAAYFLTVYDFVRFARHEGILCQGRGSAANSVVCYCLGITSVDPSKFKLLFARFMSDARDEPPDIDVDFEHERREEVIQYVYNKYGRHRAAIVATVTQVHYKGAVRDVAKAMGLSVDAINRLSGSGWEFTDDWYNGKNITAEGFDANDAHLRKIMELTRQYIGFPRQLGQHTGGFVITRDKLSDLCPIMNARMENRINIEWNKDDIEVLGFLKVDVLALGMLTCIRKAFDLVKLHDGKEFTLANIPQDDPRVYEMISHADTIGVFQIESRAQMSMLPRLKPQNFYDLVIEVAIVRPGPIQGDMVHPYLRRRNGLEPIEYPSKELEEILGRTLGVPLFQEQAMEIAIVAAGFTPAEADQLRRSMATFKANGQVSRFRKKLVDGMTAKGYTEEFALRVFKQLEGFGSYGFPESHAASFALLVYVSSWIKYYYPDVFAAALLNSMPMGFYQPAQIVGDAVKHGVKMLEVDVNYSQWDNILEETATPEAELCKAVLPNTSDEGKRKKIPLRLGFRQVSGLKQEDMERLIALRKRPFTSIHFLKDSGITQATLERLADADAFRSMGLDRRRALWEVTAMNANAAGMFKGQVQQTVFEREVKLPVMSLSEQVLHDYASIALSIKAHPVSFIRDKLSRLQVTPNDKLVELADGMMVRVAGLVLVRQRPGTASGICFITIEDEHCSANLVVFKHLFEKYRRDIVRARLLMVEGKLQREGEVTHVVAMRCYDISSLLRQLGPNSQPLTTSLSRADERGDNNPDSRDIKAQKQLAEQVEVFPGGRNFR